MRLPLIAVFAVAFAAAAAAMPTTQPTLPALAVGGNQPRTFIVDGSLDVENQLHLAFRVVADDERQLCVLYDPADGTPLFLSDGRQTLVYDLLRSRIVRIPKTCGYVSFDFEPDQASPVALTFGVDAKSDVTKLDASASRFQLDHFTAAYAGEFDRRERPGSAELYVVETPKAVRSVELDADDASHFRFTSTSHDETGTTTLTISAAHIGGPVPASAVKFPDVALLGRSVRVDDFTDALPQVIASFVAGSQGWFVKAVLAGEGEARRRAEALRPDLDWEQLARWDADFGPKYRAALAEQGVTFPTRPATRPAE